MECMQHAARGAPGRDTSRSPCPSARGKSTSYPAAARGGPSSAIDCGQSANPCKTTTTPRKVVDRDGKRIGTQPSWTPLGRLTTDCTYISHAAMYAALLGGGRGVWERISGRTSRHGLAKVPKSRMPSCIVANAHSPVPSASATAMATKHKRGRNVGVVALRVNFVSTFIEERRRVTAYWAAAAANRQQQQVRQPQQVRQHAETRRRAAARVNKKLPYVAKFG